VWRQQDANQIIHVQVSGRRVGDDGEDGLQGVGQPLQEEQEGSDPGGAWAPGTHPALLDSAAAAARPGQGGGPAVDRDAQPFNYGRGQGGLPALVAVEGLACHHRVQLPSAAGIRSLAYHLTKVSYIKIMSSILTLVLISSGSWCP
jgi:hypothetical protein